MHRARWWLALTLMAILVACHRAPAVSNPFLGGTSEREYPQGTFTYDLMAVGQHLRGRVTIEDSLVILEPVGDSCERAGSLDANWRRNPVVAFSCLGIPVSGLPAEQRTTLLSIHLQYPRSRSRWSRIDRVRVVDIYSQPDPQRCLRWTETRRGTPVCLVYDSLPPLSHSRAEPVWENGLLSLMPAFLVKPDTGRSLPERPR